MPGESLITIRGVPSVPSIVEVNARSAPTTDAAIVFKVPVGMSGLTILDVQPDAGNNQLNGKIYQWFFLRFPGGAAAWVRDDLLLLQGDARRWGYPDLSQPVPAFDLMRSATTPIVQPVNEPIEAPVGERGGAAPVTDTAPDAEALARIQRVSFAITSAFEGSGYAAYQNIDAGIVSYGFLQFTLAAGSLVTVIQRYLAHSDSEIAGRLRAYQERVAQRDPLLRGDNGFREALIAAASEPAMQAAQNSVAIEGFWRQVVEGYLVPRQLVLPLSYALLFDMGVNFGVNHGFVRLAEQQLGVPPRSVPSQVGITERILMARVAELRKQSHDRQAERDNLPGLRVRGDFWVGLMQQADWGLLGGALGRYLVNGRSVSAR